MTTYLLDTNHISPLVTVGHSLRVKLSERQQAGDTFVIPSPVLSEFLFGIGGLPRARQNMQEWQLLKADFAIYSVDTTIAEQAAELRINLRKHGVQFGLVDAFSAIIALQGKFVLLTTDADFQALPQLRQENWLR
jgi:tRNA(fMet)-specific endonuclease VapC